ncbi:capsular polysaccharide synthesis protein [Propionibacteriaceae bacterium Y1923]|uniref:capsular polysaccharide synthesis protein n=1 Tax=Aestuariimicrobium sp. Y1814 TaxID=3418742 RepID=UPI003C1F4ABB
MEPRRIAARDAVYARLERLAPYEFDPGYYPHHFVRRPSLITSTPGPAPRRIWTAWMGDNEMTQSRRDSLRSIRRLHPRFEVELVTMDSFPEHLVEGHPIHPGFESLGPVQKSDYVRCYLLHHHGGVWLDLKPTTVGWDATLDRLNERDDLWVAGYPEVTTRYVALEPGVLGKHLVRHYTRLLGASAYAMKAYSPFTSDWYEEQHARLTYWLDPLQRFPATSPYEIPRDHPIGWGELAYNITHPLSLKYGPHLLLDGELTPELRNYR